MRSKHASRGGRITATDTKARKVATTWVLTLILGALVVVPPVAADSGPSQTDLERWIAEGGWYDGAFGGASSVNLTAASQIGQAEVSHWAAEAGYYGGGYLGARAGLVAATPQMGPTEAEIWAAEGGYYGGSYPGASSWEAGFASLADQPEMQCWVTEAGYYTPADQVCAGLVAATPETGLTEAEIWAAEGGYYGGSYPGASSWEAGLASLAGQPEIQCRATEAGYYTPADQVC
jgi:hypothetical protein